MTLSDRYEMAEELGVDMKTDKIRHYRDAEPLNAFFKVCGPVAGTDGKRLVLTTQPTVNLAQREQEWVAMPEDDLAEVRQ